MVSAHVVRAPMPPYEDRGCTAGPYRGRILEVIGEVHALRGRTACNGTITGRRWGSLPGVRPLHMCSRRTHRKRHRTPPTLRVHMPHIGTANFKSSVVVRMRRVIKLAVWRLQRPRATPGQTGSVSASPRSSERARKRCRRQQKCSTSPIEGGLEGTWRLLDEIDAAGKSETASELRPHGCVARRAGAIVSVARQLRCGPAECSDGRVRQGLVDPRLAARYPSRPRSSGRSEAGCSTA